MEDIKTRLSVHNRCKLNFSRDSSDSYCTEKSPIFTIKVEVVKSSVISSIQLFRKSTKKNC